MKKYISSCLVLYVLFTGAVYADSSAQSGQSMSSDQLNRILQSVISQREQALNAVAFCQGDEADLQQQLAAAQAKIAELTKELAAIKPAPTK